VQEKIGQYLHNRELKKARRPHRGAEGEGAGQVFIDAPAGYDRGPRAQAAPVLFVLGLGLSLVMLVRGQPAGDSSTCWRAAGCSRLAVC
jgi:hypothetical protein